MEWYVRFVIACLGTVIICQHMFRLVKGYRCPSCGTADFNFGE